MRKCLQLLTIITLGLCSLSPGAVELYNYNYGVVTTCTGSCANIASLDVGTTVSGFIEIDTTPGGSFADADVGIVTLFWFHSAVPPSGPVGDPATDNPYVLSSELGVVASNGTSGTTDANNDLVSGQILLEILVPPFNSNGAFIIFNLAAGTGQLCYFYTAAGCIPGATEVARFEGQFNLADSDKDSVSDGTDNCRYYFNPDQRDTDGDGYGNICDFDLNNDCIVNYIDLGIFKTVESTSNADADFNGDGIVDLVDLDLLKPKFLQSLADVVFYGPCDTLLQRGAP